MKKIIFIVIGVIVLSGAGFASAKFGVFKKDHKSVVEKAEPKQETTTEVTKNTSPVLEEVKKEEVAITPQSTPSIKNQTAQTQPAVTSPSQQTQTVTQATQPVKTFKIDQDKLNSAGLQREIAKRKIDSFTENLSSWQTAQSDAPNECLRWENQFNADNGSWPTPALIEAHCGQNDRRISDGINSANEGITYWSGQYNYWDNQYNEILKGYWE